MRKRLIVLHRWNRELGVSSVDRILFFETRGIEKGVSRFPKNGLSEALSLKGPMA